MGWAAAPGVDLQGLPCALPAQVEGSDVRDKSGFFLLRQGQKFRPPRPRLRVT